MRKHLSIFLASLFLLSACQKNDKVVDESSELQTIGERKCAADEVLQAQLAADPALRQRMNDIERFISRVIETESVKAGGIITIPVVVNVLYRTQQESISDAQINSQITVLNEDFANTNVDGQTNTGEWSDEQGSVGVKFVLAPTNTPTPGIVRKSSRKKSWSANDDMKRSSRGGIDPTEPTKYLNMWVCNLGQGLLGYAQFPGGDPATDGIVVLYSAFGSEDKAPGTYTSSYDVGRTATHEIGHWLNLRHIWGDGTCGNDLVNDTPPHRTSNGGCPAPKAITCSGNTTNNSYEMTMNYMDYTYDRCMYMFTEGQSARANATLVSGGPRAGYIQQP